MDSDAEKSSDRISNLDDDILCQILYFLPTKYAVGTSILSKRWRYLWTSVPNFDFDSSLHSKLTQKKRDEIDLCFKEFVNRVLLLSDVECFKKFNLNITTPCNQHSADTWICAAIKRKAQEIVISMCVEDNFKLPPTLFTSKTLVVLNLVSGIVLKVPASVWLPSLKVLDLDSIEREKEDTFESLFRGCPALEELYIERWTLDTNWVLNISIPTLKRLILICPEDHFRGGSDGQGCKVVINTPKLEQLDLLDYVSDDFVLENSSSSLKAVVDIGHTHSITETNNYGSHIHKLFSGIKNVKFLDATLSFPTDDDTPVLPTLHNLTHLTLTADHESGWNFLTDFLECSPRLEVLTLKGNGQLGSAKCWSPPQRVPNCLLLHLEEIKIKKFNGEEHDFEAMEYLLKNAKFLKKMTIDCRQSNVNEEFCIWKKLIGIPRGSKTSLLNLIF